MKINRIVFLAVSVALAGGAHGAVDLGDLEGDAFQISQWFSGEISRLTAFNAAATPQLPAEVRSLLGMEVGLSGTVSVSDIDIAAFDALPLASLRTQFFDVADSVPVPLVLAHAKLGLVRGIDLGFKYGRADYSRDDGAADTKVTNAVWGIEARKRLMGEGMTGVVLPDVTVGLSYDRADGHVRRSERYEGSAVGGTLAADTTWTSDWETGAWTARLAASKQIVMVTPYVGMGYSKLFGTARSQAVITGTADGATPVNIAAGAGDHASEGIFHLTAGAEFVFFPTVRFNVGGLWSADDYAATVGLRFQFR